MKVALYSTITVMPQPIFFEGKVPLNYEKYSAGLLEPFAIDMTERVNDGNVKNVLELACGTGRVTRHLIQLIPTEGKLIATDISSDMLEVARSIVNDERIIWQVVDAQDLPFDGGNFDHVVCQFGLMFFPDKSKAITEVNRVLQTGGKFIFNTWDAIENNPRTIVIKKVLNDLFDDAPEEINLPHSLHDKEWLRRLMEEAGFHHVRVEQVTKITYQHPDDTAAGFTASAMVSKYLATKTESERERLIKRLKEELVNAFGKDGMRFPIRAIVVEGVKT
jgi:ubiquinone/menaquinone biosynthesis C-methylase UbiE